MKQAVLFQTRNEKESPKARFCDGLQVDLSTGAGLTRLQSRLDQVKIQDAYFYRCSENTVVHKV